MVEDDAICETMSATTLMDGAMQASFTREQLLECAEGRMFGMENAILKMEGGGLLPLKAPKSAE